MMRPSVIILGLIAILLLQISILHKGTKQLHAANYVMNMEMLGLKRYITHLQSNVKSGSKKKKDLEQKYAYLNLFDVDLLKHPKGNTSYFSSINYFYRIDILTRKLQMYDRYRNVEHYFEKIDNGINSAFLEKLSHPMAFVTVSETKNDSISIMVSHADRTDVRNHDIEFDEKFIRRINRLTGKTEKYTISKINTYEIE